jgi:hypothetical protein
VTVGVGRKITGAATAVLGTGNSTATASFDVGLCYRLPGGAVTNFAGDNFLSLRVASRTPIAVSASISIDTAGTYTLGFCVRNEVNTVNLASNDWLNGWFLITN